VEGVWSEAEEVRGLGNAWEDGFAEELDGGAAEEGAQVELYWLDEAREVVDHQDGLVFVAAQVRKYRQVRGMQELDGAASEDRVALANRDQSAHPVQQRAGHATLRFDVHRLVVVDGVDHQRQIQRLRVGS